MAILYKLTDKGGYTRRGYRNQCLWGNGVTHSGTGKGGLCGPGYIHAYTSPLLAVLLNPIHAALNPCKLWEASGEVVKSDNGLKVGCVSLTTIKELAIPVFTTNQRVYFALLCASKVYKDSDFISFVNNWVSGKDRTARAAERAARAAERAARAAESAVESAVESAAWAAERAAWAAWAASAAWAAWAASAASAAERAARAAWVAERAASAAEIDLISLAEKAYNWKESV